MPEPDGKVSILLVDDRPEKLLALEAVLEDLGQTIVRAYSGREALRHVLNHEFAVILLDVNMPGMDGFETAQLIRQRRSSQHVPIIFITAMGDEMHAARGYALGAVDYILSPVVPEVLRSKVAVFVDLFRKTEQVKRQAESLRSRAAQLQKLAAASLAINGALSIDRMLQTITDVARDVIESHQAITLFVDPRSSQRPAKAEAFTSFSDKYAEWRGRPLNLDRIAETLAAQSRTATRLTEGELRDHADWLIVRDVEIPPIRGGMLAAPLTGRDGNNLGVIYLSDRADGPFFTAADEAVIVQLAQMASIAIENTLYAEEREANRIKDEFLSTLSHELRTPLNAILGWTQLLRMGKPTEGELSRGLDVIERNVRSQTKLIEDLLDVSRITTGKLRLSVRPIALAPVIEAAVDAVRPAAAAKSIVIDVDVGGGGAADQIPGDPDRLQQVVWNLLSNAVKFTPANGRIEVALERVEGQSQIRVTDSGQGIDPKFLPYVFDRFRQADSSSTRSHGGLGIGLTIVRHIVELHGGTVRAESRGDGTGATFLVNLPVSTVRHGGASEGPTRETPAALTSAASVPPAADSNGNGDRHGRPDPAGPPARLRGLRVLIVDDEADARDIIGEILRRSGAEVTTAATAQEGLQLLGRVRPDVLVSDIAMPDEDGYAFMRCIRQLTPADGGDTPAVALTAYAREEDRARALAAGFRLHLPKPVEPEELVGAVAGLALANGSGSGRTV